MAEHKCIIGLLYNIDSSGDFVSLDELKTHIQERIEYNKLVDETPVFKDCEYLKMKEWSLSDYADKRRNTNLKRFDFCPECGKKIDWKAIKSDTEI